MIQDVPLPSEDEDGDDVSALIRALGETDRRLEELTAGEVDTVTDRQGRSYLLRRAQERWRQSTVEQQAAIIDALPANIVLLDEEGVILSANESWRQYAEANALRDANFGLGRSYLRVCDETRGEGQFEARQAAAGIRSVLSGTSGAFSMEYRCDSPTEPRWCLLTVTRIHERFPMAAVVMHFDITVRKLGEEELHRFAAAMDASPDGILLVDRADMRVIHVNEAGCLLQGRSREEILALRPWEAANMSRAELEETYDALIRGGGWGEPLQTLLPQSEGAAKWVEIRRHAKCIGGRWTIVLLARDITARKEAESKIIYLNRVYAVLSGINALIARARGRDELFRETCRIAVDQGALAMAWIGIVDESGDRVAVVASAAVPEEFLAALVERLASNTIAAPGHSPPVRVVSERTAFVSNDSQKELRGHFAEMHARHGLNSMAMLPLLVADKAVGVLSFYAREPGFFHEQQLKLLQELAANVAFAVAHIEKQERLDYLAYYDILTGLANRALFLERVAQSLRGAAQDGQKLALCLIDLERFKNINESLGRVAGDSLLRHVGQWLTSAVGDASLLARIDADRFAVVMPTVENEEEAAWRLAKLLDGLTGCSFKLNETDYRIAAKAGVALYPDDGGDADVLLKHAEVALKKAKAAGDRYLFYTLRMTETVVGRLDLENRLRRALECDEYVLHYQPKVHAANGKLSGAEALIRWQDPVTGMVPPGRFIPILEETGLIHEVGRWALDQAVRDYLRWRDAGLPVVPIAVNLSALQLRNRNFVASMQQVIGAAPGVAAGLELEITESLIMDDVKLSIAKLQAVRDMGVRIAIDDFGTGFSSLSYLSKLPVDTVKIDRSFIADMVRGPEGLSLVSIIINLAHSLKLKVVAEGVETQEQARVLRLLGCDELQGFLLSQPVPAALFEADTLCETETHLSINLPVHTGP